MSSIDQRKFDRGSEVGYTEKFLRAVLKDKFEEDAVYIVETHSGVAARLQDGTHEVVIEIPDFSPNEDNTMVLLKEVGD